MLLKVGKFMPQHMPKYGEFFAAISPKMAYTPSALQVPFPGTTYCTIHKSPRWLSFSLCGPGSHNNEISLAGCVGQVAAASIHSRLSRVF
jgi:hypothetical protein